MLAIAQQLPEITHSSAVFRQGALLSPDLDEPAVWPVRNTLAAASAASTALLLFSG